MDSGVSNCLSMRGKDALLTLFLKFLEIWVMNEWQRSPRVHTLSEQWMEVVSTEILPSLHPHSVHHQVPLIQFH